MKNEQGEKAVYNFYTWLNEQQVPEQVFADLYNRADEINPSTAMDLCELQQMGMINEVEMCLKLCRIIEGAPE